MSYGLDGHFKEALKLDQNRGFTMDDLEELTDACN